MTEAFYLPNSNYPENPFVEALPPILTEDELVLQLSTLPDYTDEERNLSTEKRLEKLNFIFDVYQPLPTTITLYHQIYHCLLTGFTQKNVYLNRQAPGRSLTLIGISGIGKTTAVMKILGLIPQVIAHKSYHGQPFFCKQINFLNVECPHDGSVKGLCLSILGEFDRLTGTGYFERATKSRLSVDGMVVQIRALSACIGLVVVDECQNIAGSKPQILNFMTQLMNEGVSMILLATPQFLPVLQQQFRLIRRANVFLLRTLPEEEFELLLDSLWRYQYTHKVVPLSADLRRFIREKSGGIPDIVAKICFYVQVDAIEQGTETFDLVSLQRSIHRHLEVVEDFIGKLQAQNTAQLLQYNDVYLPPEVPCSVSGEPEADFGDDLRKLAKDTKRQGGSLWEAMRAAGYLKGEL